MSQNRLTELQLDLRPKQGAKQAAVLALLYPGHDGLARMLLILRKKYAGVHSNQVAFPGGKVDPIDIDLRATALRETFEEVGAPPEKIQVIKALTQVYIPPSNFEVQPFLAVCQNPGTFVLQPAEVEAAIEVLLADFFDDSVLCHQTLATSYAENILVPAFNFNGHIVWGATAMILSEIKDLLKQVF